MPEKFSLQNFEGPLDLLLLLVQKDEMQIIEIAIHLLTKQLLQSFRQTMLLDKESDQMALLAELLALKSRALAFSREKAVHPPFAEESRLPLIEQLLKHCQFKELADSLQEKESQSLIHFTRMVSQEEEVSPKQLGLVDVTLEELKRLFKKVYENAPSSQMGIIKGPQWEIGEKIALLQLLLAQQKELSFAILFEKASCKEELIVTFLALLELIKQGYIIVIFEDHELKFTRQ